MTGDPETGTTPDGPKLTGPAHARGGRSLWWTVAVVLLGVVVAAGAAFAGVVYGRASAPGPDIVVQSEPVVEESPATEPMPVGPLPISPSPVPSVVGTGPAALTVTAGAPAWPVVLAAGPGLSDDATSATGYRLVNAGISGAQVAAVLAQTFGSSGQPVEEGDSWVVGAAGTPTLTVRKDPLFTWSFEDPARLGSPAVGEQFEPATAIELTNALLGGIGVDTTTVDWRVDRFSDRTSVTAWQLVAGKRTDLSWRIVFAPDGSVLEASGFSAGIEVVPDYPVIGAVTAIERSRTSPWSALGASPVPLAGLEQPTPEASASPGTPAQADGDASRPVVAVPVTDVTVTGAELGLAQYWQPDGSVLMLPSYLLTGVDGSRWSLIAVDDPYVTFIDQPYPTAAAEGR